jgi:hypothetical protein
METPKRRRVYAPINYDKSVSDYVDHQVMCVLDMHILRVKNGTALMTAWKIREDEEKAAAAEAAAAEEAPPPLRRNPRRGARGVN